MSAEQVLNQFLGALQFRHYAPQHPAPAFAGHTLEADNIASLAGFETELQTVLQLQYLPAFCSLPMALLIQALTGALPAGQAYLNIGVWQGYSLLAGMLSHPATPCIGVDNFSEFGGPQRTFEQEFQRWAGPAHRFYVQDFVEFLAAPPLAAASVGLYYFDGPHDFTAQYQALRAADPLLAPGALVMVDDSNQGPPREASLRFLSDFPNYQLLADLQTAHNGHPTFWNGLMILQKS